jgi:hypothetical protein
MMDDFTVSGDVEKLNVTIHLGPTLRSTLRYVHQVPECHKVVHLGLDQVATGSSKTIFWFIGVPAKKTLVTISPNTTRQPTTKSCAQLTYRSPKQLFTL